MKPSTRKFTAALALLLAAASVTVYTRADDPSAQKWDAPARAARKKNPITADASSVSIGKTVYVAQCLSCHGPAGKGDGPASRDINPKPHDISDPKIMEQSDGALFWKISTGKSPMPTFEKLISENDRWNVINYVRTLTRK